MKLSFLTTVVISLSILTSCKSSKSSLSQSINGKWNVVSLNSEDITPDENTPFITFDKNNSSISGFTGCNRMAGKYNAVDLDKGTIDFSAIGCTRMFCHEDKYETKFLATLGAVKSIKTQGSKMLFIDENGKSVVILKKE